MYISSLAIVHSYENKPIMLFQAVDESFFDLWLNWWALAKSVDAFPKTWTLYVACFGDSKLNDKVKAFHSKGCDHIIGREIFIKHVYLAKWMAVTNAFQTGHDLMIMDLDSMLIRNPAIILPLQSEWDIIASRDHGPGNLAYSGNWGTARLCTGFIYLRYSQAMRELVELVLRRCKKYGHDQIQFNNAVARNGIAWKSSPNVMNDDTLRHLGSLLWQHQYDLDFMGFDKTVDLAKNWTYPHVHGKYLESLGKSYANFSILLLNKIDVLRYCTKHPADLQISSLVENSPELKKKIVALHCFINMGHVGEQGVRKKEQKREVMYKLDYWVLKKNWLADLPPAHQTASTPIYSTSMSSSDSSLGKLVDHDALSKTKKLWLL